MMKCIVILIFSLMSTFLFGKEQVVVHQKLFKSGGNPSYEVVYDYDEDALTIIKYRKSGRTVKEYFFRIGDEGWPTKFEHKLQRLQIDFDYRAITPVSMPRNCAYVSLDILDDAVISNAEALLETSKTLLSENKLKNDEVGQTPLASFLVKDGAEQIELDFRVIFSNKGTLRKFIIMPKDSGMIGDIRSYRKGNFIFVEKNGKVIFTIDITSIKTDQYASFSITYADDLGKKKVQFELKRKTDRNGNSDWEILGKRTTDGKVNLEMDRDPLYGIKKSSGNPIMGAVDGIFGSLFVGGLDLFSKGKGFEKMVRKKIIKEANASPTVNSYLSKDEVEKAADEILSLTKLKRVAPIGNNEDAYRKSLQVFSRKIIHAILSEKTEGLFDQGQVKELTSEIISDFHYCLDSAKKMDSMDNCMDKFEQSAPYRLGLSTLKLILEDGLQDLEFTKSTKDEFIEKSAKYYEKCTDEKYFSLSNISKEDPSNEALEDKGHSIIFGCLLSGIIQGGSDGMHAVSKEMLAEYSGYDLVDHSEAYRSCLSDKGIMIKQKNVYSPNVSRLEKLDTNKFKDDFFDCVDSFTISLGSQIVEIEIKKHPDILEAFSSKSDVEIIVERSQVMFGECIKALPDDSDVEECKSVIEASAQIDAIELSIANKWDEMLGKGSENLWSLHSGDKNIIGSCFQDEKRKLVSGISRGDKPGPEWEKGAIACLGSSVSALGEIITPYLVDKELKENEALESIKDRANDLSSEKSIASYEIKKCFESNFSDRSNLAIVIDRLDQITEICTVKVYEAVVPKIIKMIVTDQLDGKIEKASLIETISSKLSLIARERISSFKNSKELDMFLEDFSLFATKVIFKEVTEDTVNDIVGDLEMTKNILTKDGEIYQSLFDSKFDLNIAKALESDDEDSLALAINNFKKKAMRELAPVLVKIKTEGKLSDPSFLKVNENIHKDFELKNKELLDSYDACIEMIDTSSKTVDDLFDLCLKSLTNGTFYNVVDVILDSYFISFGISPNSKEGRVLKKEIMTEEVLLKIENINDEKNSRIANIKLSQLTTTIKKRAIKALVPTILDTKLKAFIEDANLRKEKVAHLSKDVNKCLQEVEYRSNAFSGLSFENYSESDGAKELEMNLCINKMTSRAYKEVFHLVLESKSKFMHDDQFLEFGNSPERITEAGSDAFKSCLLIIEKDQHFGIDTYQQGVNGCLAMGVKEFFSSLLFELEERVKSRLKISTNISQRVGSCISSFEKTLKSQNVSAFKSLNDETYNFAKKVSQVSSEKFSIDHYLDHAFSCIKNDLVAEMVEGMYSKAASHPLFSRSKKELEAIETIYKIFPKLINKFFERENVFSVLIESESSGTEVFGINDLINILTYTENIIQGSVNLDSKSFINDVKKFDDIIQENPGFSIEELSLELLDLDLFSNLISSTVKNVARDYLGPVAKEHNLSNDDIEEILGDDIFRKLFFENPNGINLITKLKREHLIPIISSEKTSIDFENDIVSPIKNLILSDDEFGETSFVFRLFEVIMQKKLDDFYKGKDIRSRIGRWWYDVEKEDVKLANMRLQKEDYKKAYTYFKDEMIPYFLDKESFVDCNGISEKKCEKLINKETKRRIGEITDKFIYMMEYDERQKNSESIEQNLQKLDKINKKYSSEIYPEGF